MNRAGNSLAAAAAAGAPLERRGGSPTGAAVRERALDPPLGEADFISTSSPELALELALAEALLIGTCTEQQTGQTITHIAVVR
jgi:hypothetical protein